jgi:hypothetical protein
MRDARRDAWPKLRKKIDHRTETTIAVGVGRRRHEERRIDRNGSEPRENVGVAEGQELHRRPRRLQFRRQEEGLYPAFRVGEVGAGV